MRREESRLALPCTCPFLPHGMVPHSAAAALFARRREASRRKTKEKPLSAKRKYLANGVARKKEKIKRKMAMTGGGWQATEENLAINLSVAWLLVKAGG